MRRQPGKVSRTLDEAEHSRYVLHMSCLDGAFGGMAVAFCCLALSGCSGSSVAGTGSSAPPPTESATPGSDRDAHGCIGSAGYRWCERTEQCERPWELAAEKGFENSADAFRDWCRAAP